MNLCTDQACFMIIYFWLPWFDVWYKIKEKWLKRTYNAWISDSTKIVLFSILFPFSVFWVIICICFCNYLFSDDQLLCRIAHCREPPVLQYYTLSHKQLLKPPEIVLDTNQKYNLMNCFDTRSSRNKSTVNQTNELL